MGASESSGVCMFCDHFEHGTRWCCKRGAYSDIHEGCEEYECEIERPNKSSNPGRYFCEQDLLGDNNRIAYDLEDLDAYLEAIPAADVAPKSEVARKIFAEIEEALQYEIDLEDKNGRNAWGQGDVRTFQTHQYTEDKLETILVALSLFKKKYTEEKE